MAHYFVSVALVDLLAAAADRDMPDGTKGKDHGRGVVVITSSIASLHNATNVDMMSTLTTFLNPFLLALNTCLPTSNTS
jgi:hypothetical protein